MTSVEGVWERLKTAAREYAVGGARPTRADAAREVALWFDEAHVYPRPPVEVINFYAMELLSMIDGTVKESGQSYRDPRLHQTSP